jgi:23S rRNA pseudouridine1911/1915/1917 synthase
MGAQSSGGRSAPSTDPVVLYEDNHLVAVFKPAGVLVQGDASGAPTLMDAVKAWLARKYAKPGNVFLGLLHRLDRPVAGVVLFAKTSKGASRLSQQIRDRAVEKTYHALVEGRLEGEGTLVHWLAEDDGYVTAHDAPGPGRKEARLHWRALRHADGRTRVEVDLETGRKHQIRAQLAHTGHPIAGDRRYGARSEFPSGIALVAVRLRFVTATGADSITVELPPDLDPLA